MNSPMSIRRYLSFKFSIVAVLPVIVIAVFVWQFLIPQMRTQTQVQQKAMARAVAGQISAHLMGGERQLAALADYLKTQGDMESSRLFSLLDSQCGEGNIFEAVYMTDIRDYRITGIGLPLSSRSKREDLMGLDLSGRSFMHQAHGPGKPLWSETFLSTTTSRLAVALAVPLPGNLIIGEITLDKLSEFISLLPVEAGLITLVLDGQDRVVADSQQTRLGRQVNLSLLPQGAPEGGNPFAASPFDLEGRSFLGSMADIQGLGWKVLVAQPIQDALKPIRMALTMSVLVLVITLLLALATASFQAGNLSKLLRFYTEQAQAISQGRYDLQWPSSRTTELMHLGQSFERMTRLISRREKALVESEKLLKNITANVPGVVYQMKVRTGYEPPYTLSYLSPKASEIFGIEACAATFLKNFLQCLPPLDREGFLTSINTAVNRLQPWHYEGRFVKPSGEQLWFSGHANFQTEGETVVLNGVLMDITERRLMEEALRMTRFCFDKASIGIYRIGPEARILDINEEAARILGYTLEEMKSMTLYDIDPLLKSDDLSLIWERLSNNKVDRFERIHRRKDGVEIPVEITSNLLEYDGQKFSISFALDISHRRQAEKEAKRLEQALSQSQKIEAVGTLAGWIAHDFNNILSAMLGFAELSLARTEADSPVHKHLQKIVTAGLRARDLVRQIFIFSRQGELQLKPLKVGLIVKESLKLLRSALPATIDISHEIQEDMDPVMADPTQIHQIIMNLCTNAAHAMETHGGHLNVTLSQVSLSQQDMRLHPDLVPGDYAKLRVQDTGAGIPPEIMEKIFDPYFTTKETDKGTGLGLAVVHGIVKSYGGAVYVYSKPDLGTTFNIFLPAVKAEIKAEKGVIPELPRGNEHILLVDDEPSLLDVGQQLLEHLGYRVSTALDGEAALDMFRRASQAIDLVLTDMTMPGMTGDKLAVEFLKIRPDLPIILNTGHSMRISGEKALDIGIKAFIHKPVVEAELAWALRTALDENKTIN